MYRAAAKLLLLRPFLGNSGRSPVLRFPVTKPQAEVVSRFCTSANSQPFSNQIPHHTAATIPSDPTSSSSSASGSASSAAGDAPRCDRRSPKAEYQDEQARVLQAALRHVPRLGWTEEAMIAGAREVDVSPSVVGSFPRKDAALVEFFMDDCLQRLMEKIDTGNELKVLIPSQRISKLVRIRLEMQAPYMPKWPQALSIQAHPLNVPTSFKQRTMLIDEILHAAEDYATNLDWSVKRTVLGGLYTTTELYMLTDTSPDFRDTWAFLDNRMKDTFDLKKTIQEAQNLANAVGAGVGNSLQGLVGKLFQR